MMRWIAAENLKMPREAAAELLFDHCLNDWRDVIMSTRLPALVERTGKRQVVRQVGR